MINELVLSVIIVIVLMAIIYIVKAKAKGTKCIGCPNGGCDGECHCND